MGGGTVKGAFDATQGARFHHDPSLGTHTHKQKVAPRGGKPKDNVPSWAKGQAPLVGESGKDFATRILDEKYGKGEYEKGPRTEHNRIKKWADEHFK
jgi:hypothetical protein